MSGTVIEILMDFVACRVRVQREPVRDRMVSRRRSGCFILLKVVLYFDLCLK
jgi:hypothetical protein